MDREISKSREIIILQLQYELRFELQSVILSELLKKKKKKFSQQLKCSNSYKAKFRSQSIHGI